mmetsp:Transcript_77004/g.238489  ORF Transcript_77004/g.238489 Transcript_77004/m.238489 type:complete len:240 (-) Transcript_77004:20-739(-)
MARGRLHRGAGPVALLFLLLLLLLPLLPPLLGAGSPADRRLAHVLGCRAVGGPPRPRAEAVRPPGPAAAALPPAELGHAPLRELDTGRRQALHRGAQAPRGGLLARQRLRGARVRALCPPRAGLRRGQAAASGARLRLCLRLRALAAVFVLPTEPAGGRRGPQRRLPRRRRRQRGVVPVPCGELGRRPTQRSVATRRGWNGRSGCCGDDGWRSAQADGWGHRGAARGVARRSHSGVGCG